MKVRVVRAVPGAQGIRRCMRDIALLLMASLAAAVAPAGPAGTSYLTARESDPEAMGWMQGFPPPPDRQILNDGLSFFTFPRLRWSVCHLRELLPTASISRGIGAPLALPRLPASEAAAVRSDIDALRFRPGNSETAMTWEASLSANYTDGILILHRGVIVYERYFGCLAEDRKHAAMSMTKSITGLLAEMLIAEGALKEDMMVREIIPEVGNSAFANATVRQVMDMTTDVAFSEDYADPNADIWLYSAAASPLPKPADYTGPDGYWEYLQQVQGGAKHGRQFGYRTINSDMLGWIVSRVAGQSITDIVSQRLWRPMGAEQDAYMTVDARGVPFAGGGLTAGLRDMGRIGLLLLNEGRLRDRQVFPAAVSASIRSGGDPDKFSGFPTLAGASYRSQWWVLHDDHGSFAARGVHGQTVYIDPAAGMVLVRFASAPRARNAYLDPTSLPAYRAVADYLLTRK